MNNNDAIIYQILNGKNGMPAFGGRLEIKDIEEYLRYWSIQESTVWPRSSDPILYSKLLYDIGHFLDI